MLAGRRADPLYVVFFVTEQCTARCGHCLLGQRECTGHELTLEQIERWARRMPEFYFFLPTGGEPFLRADLPDIVRAFVRHCGVRNVGIPTNGSLTDSVVTAVERMLAENPNVDLAVDVSLDGPADLHDRIRATPGLFEKATATFRALAEIANKQKRFNVNAAVTISSHNQATAMDFLDYLVDDLGVRNINHLLVRGEPRCPDSLHVNIENYKAFNRKLEHAMKTGRLCGYHGYDVAGGVNAMKLVRQDVIARTAETGRGQVACHAGRLGAVVRADGSVYACELRHECLGTLRDAEFDFRKIWRAPQARAVRRRIRDEKCFCTYECFMTLNVLFDPVQSLRVAREWAALRAARGAAQASPENASERRN